MPGKIICAVSEKPEHRTIFRHTAALDTYMQYVGALCRFFFLPYVSFFSLTFLFLSYFSFLFLIIRLLIQTRA